MIAAHLSFIMIVTLSSYGSANRLGLLLTCAQVDYSLGDGLVPINGSSQSSSFAILVCCYVSLLSFYSNHKREVI